MMRCLVRGISLLAVVTVAACGGGGGDSSSGGSTPVPNDDGTPPAPLVPDGDNEQPVAGSTRALSGTVDTGKLSNPRRVETKDINGATLAAEVTDDQYLIPESTGGGKLARIVLENGATLYAIIPESSSTTGNYNINTYSDAVARNWFATQGLDIDSEFGGSGGITRLPTEQELEEVNDGLSAIVADVLGVYSISNANLLTDTHDVGPGGISLFLENNPAIVESNTLSLVVTDPETDTQSFLSSGLSLATDFTSNVDAVPTVPGDVRVLPASETELVVLWQPSSDDRGVSRYQIRRDGMLIGTTPFPVFSDTQLMAATAYAYTVEAIDSTDQPSGPSLVIVAETDSAPDVTPPPAPSDVEITTGTRSLRVDWQQSAIGDVARFLLTRTTPGDEQSVNVQTTRFSDTNVNPDTNYCYTVVAEDAAGNQSPASSEVCAEITVTALRPTDTPPTPVVPTVPPVTSGSTGNGGYPAEPTVGVLGGMVDCALTLPCSAATPDGQATVDITFLDGADQDSTGNLQLLLSIVSQSDSQATLSRTSVALTDNLRFTNNSATLGDSRAFSSRPAEQELFAGISVPGFLGYTEDIGTSTVLRRLTLPVTVGDFTDETVFTNLPIGPRPAAPVDCEMQTSCQWTSYDGNITFSILSTVLPSGAGFNRTSTIEFSIVTERDTVLTMSSDTRGIGGLAGIHENSTFRLGNLSGSGRRDLEVFAGIPTSGSLNFFDIPREETLLRRLEISFTDTGLEARRPRLNPVFLNLFMMPGPVQ